MKEPLLMALLTSPPISALGTPRRRFWPFPRFPKTDLFRSTNDPVVPPLGRFYRGLPISINTRAKIRQIHNRAAPPFRRRRAPPMADRGRFPSFRETPLFSLRLPSGARTARRSFPSTLRSYSRKVTSEGAATPALLVGLYPL